MTKSVEIVSFLEEWAPLSLQETWDKSGYQINLGNQEVNSITIAMDISPRVIEEAIEKRSQMIFTHHPFFFQSMGSVDISQMKSQMLIKLLSNNISVYCAHTNLDKAKDGVNEQWAQILNLTSWDLLEEDGIGIIGPLNRGLEEFIQYLKNLGLKNFTGYGKRKEYIQKIAIVGGSGSDYIQMAKEKGADLLLTGDMTYHKGQEAFESEIMVIDLGHYSSEKFVLDQVASYISKKFPWIKIHISQGSDFVFDL